MGLSYLAVDALTGVPLGDLPDLTIDRIAVTMGQYETATGTYPLASSSTPENWLYGSAPWAVAIVLASDDTGSTQPLMGWYINQRVRTDGDSFSIPLITAEGYFDRVYVGAQSFSATDQNTIATSLVSTWAAGSISGSDVNGNVVTLPGMPFTSSVAGGAGVVRDRTYADINNQTVYAALQELMGVQGGPEWTVTWQRLSSPERYLPVFTVGTQLGYTAPAGMGPNATFEMGGTSGGGSVVSVQYTEDYSSGKGANYVTAYGTPGADGTRQQQSVAAADSRRPHIEYRWNPSTAITDSATLLAHAQQNSLLMQNGARALALTSDYLTGPRLGVDWGLGDRVGYQIGGRDQNGVETVPAFPGGLSGTARVVGWQLNADAATPTVTPILGSV